MKISIAHVNFGARERTRLVIDDRDRVHTLRALARASGDGLLAYCIMDTHAHAVIEGAADEMEGRVRRAVADYTRHFNRRHGGATELLRGRPVLVAKGTAFEVARSLRYVHDQPRKTTPPLVNDAIHFPWSSAHIFAGLAYPGPVNVRRAHELAGAENAWALPRQRPLVGLDPVPDPTALIFDPLKVSAHVTGMLAEDVASSSGAHVLRRSRAIFVALGRLESYSDTQLATVLGRTRQRVNQLANAGADPAGVAMARTLLRLPGFVASLASVAPSAEDLPGGKTFGGPATQNPQKFANGASLS